MIFIIPYFVFLYQKRVSKTLNKQLIIILILGSLQALMGWLMVKSGLVDIPRVSHYRLAIHLTLALTTFGYILWVAFNINSNQGKKSKATSTINFLIILVLLQIIYGAFVAGLRAGFVLNTWPKMGEEWIPSNMNALPSSFLNLTENLITVQFIHRTIAYLILIAFAFSAISFNNKGILKSLKFDITFIILSTQIILGIFTILWAVPIYLGVIHQATAFLLMGSLLYNRYLSTQIKIKS